MTPGPVELHWINLQERCLNQLAAIATRLHPTRVAPHLRTGVAGERTALFELRRRGYTVVATRWRSPKAPGDLDLIAWHNDTLCFIEIKTRSVRDATPADSAIDETKRRAMRRLARLYLASFPHGERDRIPVRFDTVSIYGHGPNAEVELLPGAFGF